MLKATVFLVATFTFCSTAYAQAMPLNQFLEKATALEKKGMMAIFSADAKQLKKEMAASAAEMRAERLKAQAHGRKPAYCPPAEQAGLNNVEILAHFRAIPVGQRNRMSTKDGFRSLLMKKYPCPA
jgi:hypothetical protein